MLNTTYKNMKFEYNNIIMYNKKIAINFNISKRHLKLLISKNQLIAFMLQTLHP